MDSTSFEQKLVAMLQEYMIPIVNLDKFKAQFAKAQAQAKQLGYDMSYELVDRHTVDLGVGLKPGPDGSPSKTRFDLDYQRVVVDSPQVVSVGGHRLVGMVDLNDGIIKSFYHLKIPPTVVKSSCDHCDLTRDRRVMFIFFNKSAGSFITVGSGCMEQYANISGHRLASLLTNISAIGFTSVVPEELTAPGGRHWLYLWDVVAWAYAFTRDYGYVKSLYENSTKSRVVAEVFRGSEQYEDELYRAYQQEGRPILNEEEVSTVTKIIEHYRNNPDFNSQYKHNLHAVCSRDTVSSKNIGLACSIPLAYQRDTGHVIHRKVESGVSEFVGQQGQSLSVACQLVSKQCSPSEYGGSYWTYEFIDDDGNVYSWRTGATLELELEQQVAISGKVKEHRVIRDTKFTVLTRCKVSALQAN